MIYLIDKTASRQFNMLKQLRFDFYKLIHSRVMWGVLIAALILAMVNPIISVASFHDSAFSALRGMSSTTFVNVSVVLFVAFFVGADYRSGYVKSIVTRINWAYYVLSKVIYIFAFCILFGLAYQLFFILFTLMGGGKVYEPNIYEPNISQAQYGGAVYYKLLCEVFVSFTYGMLVMFVLIASKSTIAALVVGIIYLFVSEYLYNLADIILVKVFGAKEQGYPNIISYYTVLGIEQWFYDPIYPGKMSQIAMGRYSAITLLYSLAAIGFSILIPYIRKRKN